MSYFTGREGLTWWQGIIEDVVDPEALGRVRVRIFGWHTDDKSELPTNQLPWCAALMPITSAAISGIGQSPTGALPGSWVMGFFRDGEMGQDAIIWGTVYGKPGPNSTGSGDGLYPSTDERTPGASTQGEADVNRHARGVGVDTGAGDNAGAGQGTAQHSNHGKAMNEGEVADDATNRERLSKITTKNGKSTYIATAYADNFQAFINEFEKTPAPNHPDGYTIYSIGGYVHRKSAAGTGAWSYHASGAAIDINPKENPYSNTFISDMPENSSAIAAKYGLGWGGDWNSKKDAMHFSMASGERGSVKLKRNGVVPDPATGAQTPSNPNAVSSETSSQKYGHPSGGTAPSPSPQGAPPPSADIDEWIPTNSYNEGDYVRTPALTEEQKKNQGEGGPPWTVRSGTISAAATLGISALDFGTVMSYETGGTLDPQKKGPTTKWGTHRGYIQFGEPQAEEHGVDFSTKQRAIDSQLGPSGAVVKYLRAHGVKSGMGRLEVYSAINAGGVGEKYYGRSDAGAGGAKGTVRDKVNNQMDGHETNARRMLKGADGSAFIEQTVFRATVAGTSGDDGGPKTSNLTDGEVVWEKAPDSIQDSSSQAQKDAAEAAGQTTTDGYTNAPQGTGGSGTQPPKPHAVQEKNKTQVTTELFSEPAAPFAAEYPYNKVLFTESGHLQEFDDTPGGERINTEHRTGTFQEMHPDGSMVTKVTKDNYEIVFGNDNIYVRGTLNIVVDKDVNIKISGAVNADIGKSLDTKSGGNTTIKAPRIDLNP